MSPLIYQPFMLALTPLLGASVAHAAATGSTGDAPPPPVHFEPLAPHAGALIPWAIHPGWFTLLALGLAALLWAGLAFKRALDEDPYRLRRAGRYELKRLMSRLKRAGGVLRPVDLHAWCQAAARAWGVRVSAPTGTQVVRSMDALNADVAQQHRWMRLWHSAERALYAAGGTPAHSWVEETCAAAEEVEVPPRQNWLPKSRHHWLPHLAVWLCVLPMLGGPIGVSPAHSTPPAASAPPPAAQSTAAPAPDAQMAAGLAAAQGPALRALQSHWDDWAAHYDVGTQQLAHGNWNYAVAHLSAAFVQHPSSTRVRDNLRYVLQVSGTMDPTLRRLLYGAWFQSYPAWLSPAAWQRLGLLAALLAGSGLCAGVLSLYERRYSRELRLYGSWSVSVCAATILVCVMAWNGWGELHRADITMLVDGINLSPVPTDLVPEQETSPVSPGALALPAQAFLDWRQVRIIGVPGVASGWVRGGSIMPLY